MDITTLFLFELKRQSKFAIIAYSDIQQSLTSHDIDRIWYSIQSFLVAVGNISKILWGTDDAIRNRRTDLRQLLLIDDSSVLNSRRFRNHFEHFDERLEDWTNTVKGSVVDSNVGPSGFISTPQGESSYLRNFDNQKFVLTFRGEEYQFQPVFDAVQILFNTATNELYKRIFSHNHS